MNTLKRVSATLFLLASAIFLCAQNQVAIGTSGASASQVGRNRGVLEGKTRLPGQHNAVHVVARHPKAGCLKTEECGTIFYDTQSMNLVTNAGLNWLADIMSNTTTPAVNAQCNYIGLSNGAGVPAATDTALATTVGAEIAANGLSRAQATYTHSANATTYTLAKTFTASGAQSAQAGAVFTAASVGTMCFEDTFTAASLQANDTLSVTWTITI
jgi:hypothetical protein